MRRHRIRLSQVLHEVCQELRQSLKRDRSSKFGLWGQRRSTLMEKQNQLQDVKVWQQSRELGLYHRQESLSVLQTLQSDAELHHVHACGPQKHALGVQDVIKLERARTEVYWHLCVPRGQYQIHVSPISWLLSRGDIRATKNHAKDKMGRKRLRERCLRLLWNCLHGWTELNHGHLDERYGLIV